MDELDIVKQLTNHEDNIKSLKHRMDAQEKQAKAINDLAVSVKELAINMNVMNDKQNNFATRLQELESKPGKRWEQVVSLIITTIVGALLGFLLSRIGL